MINGAGRNGKDMSCLIYFQSFACYGILPNSLVLAQIRWVNGTSFHKSLPERHFGKQLPNLTLRPEVESEGYSARLFPV